MTKEKEVKKESKKQPTEKVEKEKQSFFKMENVTSKPQRGYRKGSKYDAILNQFLNSTQTLVTLEIPDVKGNYIATQLTKRIVALNLTSKIDVSVINGLAYLEKIDKSTSPKV